MSKPACPYAWPCNAQDIIDQIDDETGLCWDTDSTLNILTGFIEEHCDPDAFRAFVQKCADSDLEAAESYAHENGIDREP